jgi:ElaB/YqjD/DUF883 family membrane-anchored ribosome-binding protein
MAVKQTAQDLSDDVAQTGQQLVDDAKATVTPLLATVRDRVVTIGGQLKDRAKDNAQVVDRYVHDNPWSFIGLGVVTGFLTAWYLGSKRSR